MSLVLSEDGCHICLSPVSRDLLWSPSPYKDDREWPQNDISQLSQQLSVQAGRSRLGQEKHSEFRGMEENTEVSQAEWELWTKFIREALPSQTEATRYRKNSLTF